MKLQALLPLVLLVGCDGGPSKEESVQIFASVNTALSNGQSAAIREAPNSDPGPNLAWSGSCSLGGSLALTGSYATGDTGSFDLQATFGGCKEAVGTLDGTLRWTASMTADTYAWSMAGAIEWTGRDGSGSCEFDLSSTIGKTSVSYKGTVCGYDLTGDVTLTGP